MTTPDARLDRVTAFARQWVQQAGAVALATNDQIDSGTFDYATWAKSMLNLFDFGLGNALELAPDMLVPCLPGVPGPTCEPERSDYIEVNPDTKVTRKIAVVPGSFKHDGSGSCDIPDQYVKFEPTELDPLATTFRIAVYWPDLRSGTYRGAVRLIPETTGTSGADIVQVIVDL